MNTPKKHHISPQFYLKKWCSEDGRINRGAHPEPNKWVFDRKLPSDVAFKKNLYRIVGSDGEKFLFEDETLTDLIDTPFAILYENILRKGVNKINDHDRRQFAIYLSSFQARSPRLLKDVFEKRFDDCSEVPENVDEIASKLGLRVSEEDKKRWPAIAKDVKGMFNSKEDFGKWVMRGMLRTSLEEAADKLLETQWMHIHVAPEYSPIITTDFPMVSMGGFGNADSFYIFPLTPSDVLIMSNKIEIFNMIYKWDQQRIIAFLNMLMIGHAKEAYYKHKGHENFIKKFLGCLLNVPVVIDWKVNLANLILDTFRYLPHYVADMNNGLGINPFK